jgi:HlyD family secretion protein
VNAVITRVPWRALAGLALIAGISVLAAACSVASGSSAEAGATEKAVRDDIVVSVGGVGRIVQARAVTRAPDTSAATTGTSTGTQPPANAVYPTTAGTIRNYVVVQGQHVAAGQPLLQLDDGGAAAAAVKQADDDVASASLELTQLLGSHSADLSLAALDVRRAKADLETLLGGTPAARKRAISAAQRNVELAQSRLARVLAPASIADIRAGEADVKKAQADLAALTKPSPAPSAAAVDAAQEAVTSAKERLAKVTGPPDPVAVSAAQLEVAQAEAALEALIAREDPPVTQAELAVARAAIAAARAKRTQVSAPADAATVTAAETDVKRAVADLETLTKKPPPSPEALAAARAALEAARLKLARLKAPANPADVKAAQLELRRARDDLTMLRLGPSAAARAAAEQAVVASQAKADQLSSSPIEIARLKVQAAETRRATARTALGQLTVRSPVGGTVTAVLSSPGSPVDRATPVATVTNLDRLAVNVDLSEFDVAQVKLGQNATVSVDALGGKTFQGKVAFVALTGTDTAGIVTFPVRVTLPHYAPLKPGMNVSVRIVVAQAEDALLVPLDAVTRDGEDATVTVVEDSGAETERPVELGLTNNESAQIVKGLKEGENVLLTEPVPAGEEE